MKKTISDYCQKIGSDSLLVQGAGGNASWKDGDTLWVKASGTWLSDAANQNIFIPVDLSHIQHAISKGDFNIAPRTNGKSNLRPSIETLLHALMPHKVVIHLHAVEILAHLIKSTCESYLHAQSGEVFVEYHKPGAALALAVNDALMGSDDVNVVFLKNHGVVIGGENIGEVDAVLQALIERVKSDVIKPLNLSKPEGGIESQVGLKYFPVEDEILHQLAVNPIYFEQLDNNWVLYPDHVVFLGAKAVTFSSLEQFQNDFLNENNPPVFIFIKDWGVFSLESISSAQRAQLKCYYDVLSRIPVNCPMNTLSEDNIAELLNWDAEQYRMNLAK